MTNNVKTDNELLLECVEFITVNIEYFEQDEIDQFEKLHKYYLTKAHRDNLDEIIHYVYHLKKVYDL